MKPAVIGAGLNVILEAGSGAALSDSTKQCMEKLLVVRHHINYAYIGRQRRLGLGLQMHVLVVNLNKLCPVVLMAVPFVQSR